MNIPLERLIEGIIATLRTDVIPNVSDSYARGQAVGVIDLLNNIGPRIEWAREPLVEAVAGKRRLLADVRALLDPSVTDPGEEPAPEAMATAALTGERDRLDGLIGDAVAAASAATGDRAEQALKLLVAHMHEEAARALKMTRKPLFAEIASGRDEGSGKT